MQEIVGEPGLFRKAFRRQIVRISLGRNCFNRDVSFFYEVLDIGVDETESDAETVAQIPLGERIVFGKFVQYLERTVWFSAGRGWFIGVHNMNIP
jgi:hypothetical protein